MQSLSPWTKRAYAAVDALDALAFSQCLSSEVCMRFGNQPPTKGRRAVRAEMSGFFASVAGIVHTVRHEWRVDVVEGSTVVLETDVAYTRHDGSVVTVPGATTYELRVEADGVERAQRMQVYIDLAPLFATPVSGADGALS